MTHFLLFAILLQKLGMLLQFHDLIHKLWSDLHLAMCVACLTRIQLFVCSSSAPSSCPLASCAHVPSTICIVHTSDYIVGHDIWVFLYFKKLSLDLSCKNTSPFLFFWMREKEKKNIKMLVVCIDVKWVKIYNFGLFIFLSDGYMVHKCGVLEII